MLNFWRAANAGTLVRLTVLAMVLVAAAFLSPASAAGKHVALVIGNSAYKTVSPLPNPANDAAAIAKSLARIGFSVTHLTDLNGSDLRRALQDFEDTAGSAEIAIVYYAGHGIELNGENYLIPVDAALLRDSHVEDETVPLSRVMRAIEGASALNLVILDACRDNPFAQKMQRSSGQRSIGRGLARVEPSGRTLVAYAAKGGTTAEDGEGEHSPFAAALLNHLETPGLEVTFLFREVHDDVLAATAQQQEPFLYGSLGATPIYLVPPGETPVAETPPAEPVVETSPPTTGDPLMEADYLAALRTNTEEAYRTFLEKHPSSAREGQVNGLLAALVENEVWTEVSDEDTVAAYQRYLAAFAGGAYAAEAETRMQHLFEERRQLASRTTEDPAASAGSCGHPHGDYRVIGIAADDVLWVRRDPQRTAEELGSMPPNADGVGVGRCINVNGYSFQWCEVRYRCTSGWAYARYLEEGGASVGVSEGETYRVFGIAADDVLNMREGPGTAYPIIVAIPPDARGINVTYCSAASGSANKWCSIAWHGMYGWASACCLAGERSGLRPD